MFKKAILSILLVFGCINLSGCILLIPAAIGVVVGGGIAIGTAKWMSDKLVEDVPHPLPQTVSAAQAGVKDLGLELIKQTDTDKLVQLSCKYTDGKTVWISLVYRSNSVSRIEVRVGSWGGKEDANKILEKILSHF